MVEEALRSSELSLWEGDAHGKGTTEQEDAEQKCCSSWQKDKCTTHDLLLATSYWKWLTYFFGNTCWFENKASFLGTFLG